MPTQAPEGTGRAAAAAGTKPALETWLSHEYRVTATSLTRCISATDLVKVRGAFGQTIVPKRGSVLGALQIASYDPDPDYFFHWLRDSSLVMDALRILILDGALGREALAHFADFLRFSLDLRRLSGPAVLQQRDVRRGVDPDFLRYVRSDAELSQVHGDRVLGETRFNPDGTLDVIAWSRPQHDGPALRALAVMRYGCLAHALDSDGAAAMRDLLYGDLDFTEQHWPEPCFDIWEEELANHYYTRLVQSAALEQGAAWADGLGESLRAHRYRVAADAARQSLGRHWSDEEMFYRSRLSAEAGHPEKALDIAVILAVLHADLRAGTHSILDPRVQATLQALEDLFAADYAINRRQGLAPAMGRYKADRYFSGGAYYFSTLAAAEFYFRLAVAVGDGATFEATTCNRNFISRLTGRAELSIGEAFPPAAGDRRGLLEALLRRGDAFMETVRTFTPESGELSEQFDQTTGLQSSGKNVAWSYAAFVTACNARKRALKPLAAQP